MARFKRISHEVEAEQWSPGKTVAGVRTREIDGVLHTFCLTLGKVVVFVSPGDWVIQEVVQNEPGHVLCYAISDEMFKLNYTQVT